MVHIFYRTLDAISEAPVALTVPTDGLRKEDYELVHVLDNSAPHLEAIYRMMNVISGNELPVRLGIRTMTVGDVIVDEDGTVWFAGASDWEETSWF
jgi:hypothetical protein